MTNIELLEKAKRVTGSDSATARQIGMNQGHISAVRNGMRTLSAYQAAKIAEIIGERWYDVALPALAAKAKTSKESQFWMGKLEMLQRIAVPASLAAFLAMIPLRGVGENSPSLSKSGALSMYIMLIAIEYFRRTVGVGNAELDPETDFCAKRTPRCAGFFIGIPRQYITATKPKTRSASAHRRNSEAAAR